MKTVVPIEEIKNVGKGRAATIGSGEPSLELIESSLLLYYSPVQNLKTEFGMDAPERYGKWLISASFIIYYCCFLIILIHSNNSTCTKGDASYSSTTFSGHDR